MNGKFTFLGSGASLGVPVVACECEVCKSSSPFNKRLRPSGVLEFDGKKILIDAGPDLRAQALRLPLNSLDGLMLTHAHHDHSAGMDELRLYHFLKKHPIPCLMSEESAEEVRMRYHYMLSEQPNEIKDNTRITLQILEGDRGETEFLGLKVAYFSYVQIGMKVNAFRCGDFAYVTDIKHFDPAIFDFLKGVKTLVLSALRFTPTIMHLSVDDAIDFVKEAGSPQTFLTHISHDLDHEKTNNYLPPHIRMSYDGLTFDVKDL